MKKRSFYKKTLLYLTEQWSIILLIIVMLGAVSAILLYQLGSLVPGFSSTETIVADRISQNDISLRNNVLLHPLYSMFYGITYLMQIFWDTVSPLRLRLSSVLLGATSIASIFYILQRWHTFRIALLTTLLYASSAGFLHAARHADPASSFLLLPAALALYMIVKDTKKPVIRIVGVALGSLILLSIPGGIWFLMLLSLWQRQVLIKQLKLLSQVQQVVVLSIAVATVSLFTASLLLQDSEYAFLVFGIGVPFVSVSELLSNIGQALSNLFFKGPTNPQIWIGVAPVIDAFTTVMVLLGSYVYILQRRHERTKMLFTVIGLLILLSSLGAGIEVMHIVPFFYIIAASGIALLLQQWFTVFPKNPFARTVGVLIISICIGASVAYNIHRYFIAWPHSPEVRREFSNQLHESVTIAPEQ